MEEFIKSEKLLEILIKLLDPQILFWKSQTNLQIQELSINPGKYKIFCHVLLAPAVSQRQSLPYSKLRRSGSAINVEESLRAVKYSVGSVEQ